MLRFVVLKTVGIGNEKVVLEYREDQLNARLRRRIGEFLLGKNKLLKRFTSKEIEEAVNTAFKELVKEFKEETIKIA